MEKISIFCGLCGKYIAAVPAKYAGKYTAALCKECRKQYGQSTMELDAREVRQALGMRGGDLVSHRPATGTAGKPTQTKADWG